MTRASKSYRSTTPKETRETKAERAKRLENYRIAKAQAKKFVIPGIIAVIASIFFLFVAMYGFKGTKMDRMVTRGRSASDMLFEEARKNFANNFGAAKEELKAQILEAFKKGDEKWDQEHPEDATQDYEPIVKTQGAQEEVVIE
ncbi:hypothetical protein BGZ97_010977 [Linnemannia gamsii]|uniref:Uncharacterized protein n=1 Tax=Linnemannia gamsii TaxID=64522 RepID=A0A9P6UNM9_9FUNG|nr:hypothetical protein BGZ97_010977 [Linnemannia gamsii]